MDMRKMLAQAQQMQAKLTDFKKKEFEIISSDKLIKFVINGNREIVTFDVEKLLKDPDLQGEHEMISNMLKIAINDALKTIEKEEKKIASKF